MGTLILAGEAVFIPPFHPGRYFRTTLLESIGINELQLGEAQAWYGILAMVCYALGGPLADRFSPRKLMAGSLFVTGLGSLYMATAPSLLGLKCLFAFWGASTILAFWAPLIRTTRLIGGRMSQGTAFGVLDGGRGLVAWIVAAVSAATVSGMLAQDVDDTTGALRSLMIGYATIATVVAVIVWFGLPSSLGVVRDEGPKLTVSALVGLMKRPAIWLQALVVLTAYCAFKTFDYYGHYSEDMYGLSKAQSSTLTAWLTFLRIPAAFAAGFFADRWLGVARTVRVCFGGLAISFALLYAAQENASWLPLAVANMAVAWSASCALRGVYFALLHESNIPASLTGSAAGMVSFVGFTPDIFWPLLGGWLVTSARESGDVLRGYEQLWLLLCVISCIGLMAATLLRRTAPRD